MLVSVAAKPSAGVYGLFEGGIWYNFGASQAAHRFIFPSIMANANTKYIVVGIDGTGSSAWMKPDGSNSHTHRFIKDFHYGTYGVDRMWFHGPSDTLRGMQTEPILQSALQFVVRRLYQLFPHLRNGHKPLDMFDVNTCRQIQYYRQHTHATEHGVYYDTANLRQPKRAADFAQGRQPLSVNDVRVVIVGHSRGGLAATVLAKMLSPIVKVYFLGLYDAVDRQPCLDGMVVENVHAVYHARRKADMNSRSYFSNTSVQYKTDKEPQEGFFYTTHGGIGGDFEEDRNKIAWNSDATCVPYGKEWVSTPRGAVQVDRTHPVAKKYGRPINLICEDGKQAANRFIREGARLYGLPIN